MWLPSVGVRRGPGQNQITWRRVPPHRVNRRSPLNMTVLCPRNSSKGTRDNEYDECKGLHGENSYLTGRGEKGCAGALAGICDGGADVKGRETVGDVLLMVPGGNVKRFG